MPDTQQVARWVELAHGFDEDVAAIDLQDGGGTYDKAEQKWSNYARLVVVLRRPGDEHTQYSGEELQRWLAGTDQERDTARRNARALAERLAVPLSTLSFDQEMCSVEVTWIGQQTPVTCAWPAHYSLTYYRQDGVPVHQQRRIEVEVEKGYQVFVASMKSVVETEALADCLYTLKVTAEGLDGDGVSYTSHLPYPSTLPTANQLRRTAAREEPLSSMLRTASVLELMTALRTAFWLPFSEQTELRAWVSGTVSDAAFDCWLLERLSERPDWQPTADVCRRLDAGQSAGTILLALGKSFRLPLALEVLGYKIDSHKELFVRTSAATSAQELDEWLSTQECVA